MFVIGGIVAGCLKMDDAGIDKTKKFNAAARFGVGCVLADVFLITALVVGILGVSGVLHGLPPAAAYTFIGLGGMSILSWTVLTVVTKGDMLVIVKDLLIDSISSDPKGKWGKSKPA